MKNIYIFGILFFSLILNRAAQAQCENILAVNDVQYLGCGEVKFNFTIEKGTGPFNFDWKINGMHYNTPSVNLKFVGRRYIVYSIEIKNGCSFNYFKDSIWIDYAPVSVMASYSIENCTDVNFNFISTNQTALPKYIKWIGEGGLNSSELLPTHTYPQPGTYHYQLQYLAQNACDTSKFEGEVRIVNVATADAGQPKTICIYEGLTLLEGTPKGGKWSGAGINGNYFDAEAAGLGTHKLIYTTQVNQCIASSEVFYTVKEINSEFTVNQTEGEAPLTIDFNVSVLANQKVEWDFGDKQFNQSFSPQTNHTYQQPGYYSIRLKVYDEETGCSSENYNQFMIKVSEKKQATYQFNQGLAIYPNPTKGDFRFLVEKDLNVSYQIQIISLDGYTLLNSQPEIKSSSTDMSLSHLPTGLYLVKATLSNGQVYVGKVVILN